MKYEAAELVKQGLLSLGSRGVGRGIHRPLDLSLWRGNPQKGGLRGSKQPPTTPVSHGALEREAAGKCHLLSAQHTLNTSSSESKPAGAAAFMLLLETLIQQTWAHPLPPFWLWCVLVPARALALQGAVSSAKAAGCKSPSPPQQCQELPGLSDFPVPCRCRPHPWRDLCYPWDRNARMRLVLANVMLWLCLSPSCQSALGAQGCSAGARTMEAFGLLWTMAKVIWSILVCPAPSHSQLAL